MSWYGKKMLDPRWQEKRLIVFQRDKFTCKKCLSNENELCVHHLKYEYGKNPWDYENDVLITLCKDCHDKEHDAKKRFLSLIPKVMKNNLYYTDILDVFCLIFRMFRSRQVYNYFYAKLDKLISEIEQKLDI